MVDRENFESLAVIGDVSSSSVRLWRRGIQTVRMKGDQHKTLLFPHDSVVDLFDLSRPTRSVTTELKRPTKKKKSKDDEIPNFGCFLPEYGYLAVAYPQRFAIFDLETGALLSLSRKLHPYSDGIFQSLDVHEQLRQAYFTSLESKELIVLSLYTGEEIDRVAPQLMADYRTFSVGSDWDKHQLYLSHSRDPGLGRVPGSSWSSAISVWDVRKLDRFVGLIPLRSFRGTATVATRVRENLWASATTNGLVEFWNPRELTREKRFFPGWSHGISSLHFSAPPNTRYSWQTPASDEEETGISRSLRNEIVEFVLQTDQLLTCRVVLVKRRMMLKCSRAMILC